MGLSVSASAGVIFIGFLMVFGTIYPALTSRREDLDESERELRQFYNEKENIDILIEDVFFSEEDGMLYINGTNSGNVPFHISSIDIFVNRSYFDHLSNHTTVEGYEWGREVFPDDLFSVGIDAEPDTPIKLVDGYGNNYMYEDDVMEGDNHSI